MQSRILCCLALAALTQSAAAQSIEVERLQLDPSARGSLVLGSGEVAPQHSFRLSVAGQWEHLPLVLANGNDVLGRRDDRAARPLLEDRQTLHLSLDYVILPRVEIYGRAPFVVSQNGPGVVGTDNSGWGMPSFGLRLGLAQQSSGAPMNVAIAGEFLPGWGTSAINAKWTDRPAGLVRLEIGRDMGGAVLAVNGGYLFRDKLLVGQRTIGSEGQAGIVLAGTKMVRPEISFRGAFGATGDRGPASAELLGGLRVVGGPMEVFALGGPGFFNREGTPQWRALAGFAVRSWDAPKQPEPAKAPPPPPPPPAVAPPPPPVDPCAVGQTHTPDQCPDLDDDGDGVPNKDDACPTEKGLPELKGCPAKDSDGDGVPDHLDKCPNEPGPADNQGCPRVIVQKETKKVELREQVLFDTGKATIKPQSSSLLDEIANVMKAHSEIKRVQVEGHSDSTGGKALNRRLSQRRAAAVATALQDRGIAADRLSSRGFGPSKPIAPNDTAAGREKNRRVEISITEQSE